MPDLLKKKSPDLERDNMPLYSFRCPKCGTKDERMRAMQNADKMCVCSCGAKMNRDFAADMPFASGDYKRAVHSDSLAISPEQREEHLKTFPNIKLDSQNRPVFDNFQAHENYIKKCNIVKERQRIKPKGKRIA